MTAYAELEIGVHGTPTDAYQIELRFTDPESEGERPPVRGEAAIDRKALLVLHNDPDRYGKELGAQVFQDERVLEELREVQIVFDKSNLDFLRLRLLLYAPELQGLRWELLRHPQTDVHLATSEKILFSRFLLSRSWKPIRLRPKARLRALVAVAAPSDVSKYGLAGVKRDEEIKRARASLQEIDKVDVAEAPLTLDRLKNHLREEVDILYLVCHGALVKGRTPVLYLQNADGSTRPVEGREVAETLEKLSKLPRLVVLASCESAGKEEVSLGGENPTAEVSLAPLLAELGIPAIVAMQGKIGMETVAQAMPVFFRELLRDGQIDRAMAAARDRVRDRLDHWMPALFLRLKGGRIWYEPGFAGDKSEFEQWSSICGFVHRGECVPILGPDLGEYVYGTTHELAHELAKDSGFPLTWQDRSDLAKVAQYVSTRHSLQHARSKVRGVLFKHMKERAPRLLGEAPGDPEPRKLLERIATALEKNETDPFRILTKLDAKVYVTASADPLLEMSLERAGKLPVALVSRWRDERRDEECEPEFRGEPTNDRPYLYYVFGKLTREEEWVLTEDDFFDYLIQSSKYDLMPLVVSDALTAGSLLFLGFRLDDWKFRVMFRQIRAKGGFANLENYNHVGVQVDPDEHTLADAQRAKKYLERYFLKAAIDIYWGTASDFLRDLRAQLEKTKGKEMEAQIGADLKDWG